MSDLIDADMEKLLRKLFDKDEFDLLREVITNQGLLEGSEKDV